MYIYICIGYPLSFFRVTYSFRIKKEGRNLWDTLVYTCVNIEKVCQTGKLYLILTLRRFQSNITIKVE